jgi:hypothetical protein
VALAWVVVPTLVALGISLAVLPVFTLRNMIVVMPAFLLLTAAAAARIDRFLGSRFLMTGAVAAALFLELFQRRYYVEPSKPQYREAAQRIVEANAGAAERPFVVSGAFFPAYFDYYFARQHADFRVEASAQRGAELSRIAERARPKNLWVAAPQRPSVDPPGSLVPAGYERRAHYRFVGIDVYRFVPIEPTRAASTQ